jgi:hypothetical protein
MLNQSCSMHKEDCRCFSWRPVFAGALVALGLSFLLNLFSGAIGLMAFTTNDQGIENLALGGMIATALGIVASMFAAGWVSGYLGSRSCSKGHLGALYGFLTWCLALLVMVFIADSMTKYVVFYTHFISGTPVSPAAAATSVANAVKSSVADKSLVVSAYVVFILFFLSAFASSLGGHCGMRHAAKNCENANR